MWSAGLLEILRPGQQAQINIIARVLDVSLGDEGLYGLPRADRARAANAPIYLGVDENRHHVYRQAQRYRRMNRLI